MDERVPAAFSHRESYKKHLTHLANVQQSKALGVIQKSFDKDCEDQLQRHNAESLQLRRKLKKLQKDKTYYRDNSFQDDTDPGPSGTGTFHRQGSRDSSAKKDANVIKLGQKASTSASEYEDEDDFLANAAKPMEASRGTRKPNQAIVDKWQDSLRKTAMLEEAILHLKHAHMVKDTSLLPSESKFNALLNPEKPPAKPLTEKEKEDNKKAMHVLTRWESQQKPHNFRRKASLPTPDSSEVQTGTSKWADKARSLNFQPNAPATQTTDHEPPAPGKGRNPKLQTKAFSLDESQLERRFSTGRRASERRPSERRPSERRASAGKGKAASAPAVDLKPKDSSSKTEPRLSVSKNSPAVRATSGHGNRRWSHDEAVPAVIPEMTEGKEGSSTNTRLPTIPPATGAKTPIIEARSREPSPGPSLHVDTTQPGSGPKKETVGLAPGTPRHRSESPARKLSSSDSITRNTSRHDSHSGRSQRRGSAQKGGGKGGEEKYLDEDLLARYTELIQKSLNEADPTFQAPVVPGVPPPVRRESRGVPGAAAKRSQKRRIMQLEDMLNTLPNYKKTTNELTAEQVLACSYLRLSKNNIEDCENAIRQLGKDPGVHVHMSQKQAEDYFILQDKLKEFNLMFNEEDASSLGADDATLGRDTPSADDERSSVRGSTR